MRAIARVSIAVVAVLMFQSLGSAQTPTTDQVLKGMEEANKNFPSLQANIERTKFTAAIKKLGDPQIGQIWVQRSGNSPRQIKLEFTKPGKELLFIDDGAFKHFYPVANQGETKSFDKSYQSEFECVLLGLCQFSEGIRQHFDASVTGQETIDGVNATKLELKSKDTKVTKGFATITLWLDPMRWLPVQTRVAELNGNYLNAKYTQWKTAKFSNSVFKFDFPKNAHINKLK